MKVYVAGPMRGKPCLGFHEFDRVTGLLRDAGHDVVSPADMDRNDLGWPECPTDDLLATFDIADAMRRDFAAILAVDAIVLLDGWAGSTGTAHELYVARVIGLPIFEFIDLDDAHWLLLPAVRVAA